MIEFDVISKYSMMDIHLSHSNGMYVALLKRLILAMISFFFYSSRELATIYRLAM